MKRATTAVAFAALASLALSAPLQSQAGAATRTSWDFTITVPVSLDAIPANVTRVAIACDIMPEDYSNGSNQIAHGVVTESITSHEMHRNITVLANAAPGKDPSLARWYQCRMSFIGSDRGHDVTYFLNGVSTPPVFPLAPGAAVNIGGGKWFRIPGVSH
jgi:hypothetical protein